MLKILPSKYKIILWIVIIIIIVAPIFFFVRSYNKLLSNNNDLSKQIGASKQENSQLKDQYNTKVKDMCGVIKSKDDQIKIEQQKAQDAANAVYALQQQLSVTQKNYTDSMNQLSSLKGKLNEDYLSQTIPDDVLRILNN